MAQPKSPKPPRFKPDWQPVVGCESAFRLGNHGSYWKGKKGWWASRKGDENIKGPFRGPNQARQWVEEPLREIHAKRVENFLGRQQDRLAEAEAKVRRTWGELAPEERVLQPGQVWAMKDPAYPDRQLLLVSIRKDTVVALVRAGEAPWSQSKRDVRAIQGIPRLYRLIGMENTEVLQKELA